MKINWRENNLETYNKKKAEGNSAHVSEDVKRHLYYEPATRVVFDLPCLFIEITTGGKIAPK